MAFISLAPCTRCTYVHAGSDTAQGCAGTPGWQVAGGLQVSRQGVHGPQVWKHRACKVPSAATALLALHPACTELPATTSQHALA